MRVNMHSWLSDDKFFMLRNCEEWSPFLNIVTDMSYACLNAIATAWNGNSSIYDYLNSCYKVLCGSEELQQNTVIINLCCSHYTKIIISHALAYYSESKKDSRKNLIISIIALLFNITEYGALIIWFRHFVIILCSKSKTEEFLKSFSFLTNLLKSKSDRYCQKEINQSQQLSDSFKMVLCMKSTRNLLCTWSSVILLQIHEQLWKA